MRVKSINAIKTINDINYGLCIATFNILCEVKYKNEHKKKEDLSPPFSVLMVLMICSQFHPYV